MAGINEMMSGIGLRYVYVAERDTDGTIKVPSGTATATAYRGLRVSGANAFTLAVADAVRVAVTGDDRVYHTWQLPPNENSAGELRVSKGDNAVVSLITGTLQHGSPERNTVGFGTDKQGEEPNLIMWASRQVIEASEALASFGQKRWETYYLMSALAFPRPAPMEYQTVGEWTYSIVANDASIDQVGRTFTVVVNGYTSAEFLRIVSIGKYMLDAFIGTGAVSLFNLSETPLNSANSPLVVTVNGVIKQPTTDYTFSTNQILFGAPPALAAKVLVEYEY